MNLLLIIFTLIALFWGLSRKFETSIWIVLVATALLYTGYSLHLIEEFPLTIIVSSVKKSFSDIALIIMLLFGYSHYMQHLNANESLIKIAVKPIGQIKYPYILLMALFILASFLSVVITSAAALAIILLSTFYPILRSVGISKFSIAAIIVSAAGIMPSPLAVETHLSAEALQLPIQEYIKLSYRITIPMLIGMAILHGWWQWHCDRSLNQVEEKTQSSLSITKKDIFYAPLPFLPLILFITYSLIFPQQEADIFPILLISLALSLCLDMLYHRNFSVAAKSLSTFWQGMSLGLVQVGSIVISAGLLVQALKEAGLISLFQNYLHYNHSSSSLILVMVLMISIIIVGISSGSGLALYFGLAPLVPTFASLGDLDGWRLSTLLEVTAHTSRTFSFLAAVMIVTSKHLEIPISSIIKRTWLPVLGAWVILLVQVFI